MSNVRVTAMGLAIKKDSPEGRAISAIAQTKYYCLHRHGRKWVAVAAVVYPAGAMTCRARAESDMGQRGYVMEAKRAESQKNWGGCVENMQTIMKE